VVLASATTSWLYMSATYPTCTPTSITFTATITDNQSGVASAAIKFLNTQTGAAFSQRMSKGSGTTWRYTLQGSGINTGQGYYQVQIRATDRSGNAVPYAPFDKANFSANACFG
jgi:hypothetical protein